MHISIEGMDGVGKTTTAKMVATELGYQFVDKPLHYLFDEEGYDNYIRIRNIVNSSSNRLFTAWFYGLSNIYAYEQFAGKNIVTDRHFLSNFAWSGTDDNTEVYDLLVQKIGKPTLTVILYASDDTIISRIKGRDATDKDVNKVAESKRLYEKMVDFSNKYELPYMVIDTSSLAPADVVKVIIEKVRAITHD